MQQIIFELETMTPLFMAGADGRTPELRPPSFKGMMRFWRQAMRARNKIPSIIVGKKATVMILCNIRSRRSKTHNFIAIPLKDNFDRIWQNHLPKRIGK